MPTDKVKEFIKKLGAPKLTVIDHFCYDNDCTEDEFIREADEEKEIRFIKKWLVRNLGAEERRELIKRGCL